MSARFLRGRADAARRAERLAAPLLAWFREHGRTLPWRAQRLPYRVVVSEFMLQQTQVERVLPIFERFVAAFPTFAALAAAPRGEVVRAWRGLGYNSRAVRLHALARTICERYGGELPRSGDALLALPGVGPYTSSAIRAFAFDCSELALDTNVRRVLARALYGVERLPPAALSLSAAEPLLSAAPGSEVNAALMDLGATLCTARAPRCLLCPLAAACRAAPVDATRAVSLRARGPSVPFERTTRYLRGRIVDALRALPPRGRVSLLDLHRDLSAVATGRSVEELSAASNALVRDGLVAFDGTHLSLIE